jgi:transcriptional regulator with XRE-family HTH domain
MEELDAAKIGKRIRELRKIKKLTQEKLAEISGVSVVLIGTLETKGRNISIETLVKLLDGLNVSFIEFFSAFESTENDTANLIELLSRSNNIKDYIDVFTKILKMESSDI